MRTIFIRREQPETHPALLFFIGVILALCSLATGAVAGFEYRDRIQRELDRQPKPRPVAQNPPPPLIPCNDPLKSRELVNQICRARKNAI